MSRSECGECLFKNKGGPTTLRWWWSSDLTVIHWQRIASGVVPVKNGWYIISTQNCIAAPILGLYCDQMHPTPVTGPCAMEYPRLRVRTVCVGTLSINFHSSLEEPRSEGRSSQRARRFQQRTGRAVSSKKHRARGKRARRATTEHVRTIRFRWGLETRLDSSCTKTGFSILHKLGLLEQTWLEVLERRM